MKIKMNQGLKHCIKHVSYTGGRKKVKPLWNFLIKTRGRDKMFPLLENLLLKVQSKGDALLFPAIA
ncbi:MAG TPA: hypothetical protein VEY10_00100 [Flavisolibacter sp.]|nr:hypothetical protein [Flavisolibacter sp.]